MPAKQYGPRYGRRVRKNVDRFERSARAKHKCPYCNKQSVKRVAVGIWNCRSCQMTFTGGAYSL